MAAHAGVVVVGWGGVGWSGGGTCTMKLAIGKSDSEPTTSQTHC